MTAMSDRSSEIDETATAPPSSRPSLRSSPSRENSRTTCRSATTPRNRHPWTKAASTDRRPGFRARACAQACSPRACRNSESLASLKYSRSATLIARLRPCDESLTSRPSESAMTIRSMGWKLPSLKSRNAFSSCVSSRAAKSLSLPTPEPRAGRCARGIPRKRAPVWRGRPVRRPAPGRAGASHARSDAEAGSPRRDGHDPDHQANAHRRCRSARGVVAPKHEDLRLRHQQP